MAHIIETVWIHCAGHLRGATLFDVLSLRDFGRLFGLILAEFLPLLALMCCGE